MSAKTMADVLAEHHEPDLDGGYWYCPCGHDYGIGLSNADIAGHQAATLSAAGFGPVQEAKEPEVRQATLTNGETELDEVVAFNAYVHLEAMDDNHWWLLVTSGGKSVHVNFYTKRAKISGHAEIEEAE